MTLGMLLFFAVLTAASAGLVWVARRVDRPLGWLTAALLVIYFASAVAMGAYLERVRGRTYFASDEVSYLGAGELLASDWRTGDTHTPVLPGSYPIWNAALVYVYGGGSLLPMRLANGLVGAAAPLGGFLLARHLFGDLGTARLAALLIAISPSLLLWSLTNLKERSVGTAVLFAVAASVGLVKRWGSGRLFAVVVSIALLGLLRHYYAAILGWLVIFGFIVAHRAAWRDRILRSAMVLVAIGLAQYPGAGSFLATSMARESQIDDARQVWVSGTRPEEPESSEPAAASPPPVVAPPPAAAQRPPPRIPAEPAPATVPPAPTNPVPAVAPPSPASEGVEPAPPRPDVIGRSMPEELSARLLTVLFGRFTPQGDTGRAAAMILAPDWIMSLGLTPLALAGIIFAFRTRHAEVIIPTLFLGAMLAVLTLMAVDSWAIYRFRAVYWPVLLTLGAGGAMWIFRRARPAR